MAGVLVIGETSAGQVTEATLQVAAAAGALAASLEMPVVAALPLAGPAEIAAELARCVDVLYLAQDAALGAYVADAWCAFAEAAVRACAPAVVLAPHSMASREWLPRLAARLDAGLVLDCDGLAMEDGALVASKPMHGGGARGEIVVAGRPAMASVRANALASTPQARDGEVRRLSFDAPTAGNVVLEEEVGSQAGGGPRLAQAKVIVSGGRGVGGPQHWHHIEAAAQALGAAVGCSRPVADAGWVPSAHQVGLSGTSVAPDLYVAVGISGAVHHLAGIGAARTVVAINSDPAADIFRRATLGVVGDYREVLPAFVERVKQLR